MSESFDAFLAQAWADHADSPDAVAVRLRDEAMPAPDSAAQLTALTRLTVHLFGEHLGRFDEARERLDAFAPLSADADARSALRVGRATLNLAEGRPEPMTGFSTTEALGAESGAAAMCDGRGDRARARGFIAAARRRLAALPDAQAANHRPLAVACNNMAWSLIDQGTARSTEDSAAMVELARASREHWSLAGTWLEVERADYVIARACLAAGAPDEAGRHAEQCLAACIANDAAPFEHFFAHEALARVHHARGDAAARQRHVQAATLAFERLDADDQAACRAALESLEALA